METTKHICKKIEDGEYEYRGYTIYRNDDVSDGYYGRWTSGGWRNGMGSSTLKGIKAAIDARIEAKKAA